MRKKFIVGNWKMHTNSSTARALAEAVARGVADTSVSVAVCPPFPWLGLVADVLRGKPIDVVGQNCHYAAEGAFTGEVSPQMLLDAGCRHVLIGHSERRHGLHEEDLFLNRKVKAATAAGLHVIYCIGELLSDREAKLTENVLEFQLSAGLSGLSNDAIARVAIAYEPVWAIGTGHVATTEQVHEAHSFIRGRLARQFSPDVAQKMVVAYGGSVKPDNARELLKLPDVDGALVGGASLKADSFLSIVHAAA